MTLRGTSAAAALLALAGCASLLGLENYGDAAVGGGGTGAVGGSASSSGGSGGIIMDVGSGGFGIGGFGGSGANGLGYADAVKDTGPDGYWRLGDAACATPCTAMAEHGPDGTYQGVVNFGELGAISDDAAIKLDPAMDGEVVVGPDFNYAMGQAFSLEVWVRPVQTAPSSGMCNGSGIISRENGSTCNTNMRPGYTLRLTGGCRVQFEVIDCVTSNFLIVLSMGALTEDRFYHVVATFSGSNLASIYIDGNPDNSANNAVPYVAMDPNSTFVIGARQGGAFGTFDGWLDEVAVYPLELSPTVVNAHFVAGAVQ